MVASGGTSDKESFCQCGRPEFDPWVEKIPWRRRWQPTPVFLPGKSHGLRSLAGCSPWGCQESHTTDHEHTQQILKEQCENLVKTPKCIEEAHRDVTMKPKQPEQRICHQEDTCCPCAVQHLPVSWKSFRRAGPRTQLSWVTLPCSLWSPPQRIINSPSSLARVYRMPLTYFPAFFMGLELNALWEK